MLWYKDDEIEIDFNIIPCTTMLFPLPSMSKQEKKEITDKPFLNKKPLFVTVFDKRRAEQAEYKFLIDKGYQWDGASIPRAFWRLIGSKTEPEFQIASLLHDTLCENHSFINNDRYLSTLVLIGCMKSADVCAFKRWLIKHSVDNYQKFCGWKKIKIK